MWKYTVRRALIAVLVLFILSVLVFTVISLAPGDPIQALLPPDAPVSAANVEKLYREAGLDKSIPVRYVRWITGLPRGDMGKSFQSGQPATEAIQQVLPNTLILTGFSFVLSLIIGIPLGIISALKERSILDEITTVASFILAAIPGFFLALIAVFTLAVNFKLFPTSGMYAYDKQGDLWDLIKHVALPGMVLGILHVPGYVRYIRASMLDVMRQDYIRTARAKGLQEARIIWRHTFPNALSPLITLLGLSLPGLVGGSVLIEQVFAWPGLGTLTINAAIYRDYPIVMATSLLYAVAVIFSTLVADLAYAVADPRIRYT